MKKICLLITFVLFLSPNCYAKHKILNNVIVRFYFMTYNMIQKEKVPLFLAEENKFSRAGTDFPKVQAIQIDPDDVRFRKDGIYITGLLIVVSNIDESKVFKSVIISNGWNMYYPTGPGAKRRLLSAVKNSSGLLLLRQEKGKVLATFVPNFLSIPLKKLWNVANKNNFRDAAFTFKYRKFPLPWFVTKVPN